MSARPWRAVAFLQVGEARITVARTSRASRDSLWRWVHDQRDSGLSVDWWQVQPIPEVAAQVAASLPG